MLSTFPKSGEPQVHVAPELLHAHDVQDAIYDWDEDSLLEAVGLFQGEPGELGEALHSVVMAYTDIRHDSGPPFGNESRQQAFRMLHTLCTKMTLLTNKARFIAAITEPDHLGVSVLTLAEGAGETMQRRIKAVLQCGGDSEWPDDYFLRKWSC